MVIKIHNDGKCKHQSWEAYLDIDLPLGGSLNLCAYGEDEAEAKKYLKKAVDELRGMLDSVDYTVTIPCGKYGRD